MKVLLVDDDDENCKFINDLFSAIEIGKFELKTVISYGEALEQILQNQHDVYLLDYHLGQTLKAKNGQFKGKKPFTPPGGERGLGLELLREALAKGCSGPIILLTALADLDVDMEAMNAGAADYLIKSQLDPHMLERSIRYAIERKRAEKALRLSQERYALALSGGQVGVWDWNIKTNEIYISPNLKAMLGYGDAELENGWEEWKQLLHPEDLEPVMAALETHLAGFIGQYEVEYRRLHKDGTWRWFLSRGTAVRDANGKAYRMAGSETDITERKQLEAYLRQALAQEKEVNELKSRFVTMVSHEFRTPLATILSSADLMEFYVDSRQADKLLEHINRLQNAAEYMTQMLKDVLVIGKADAGKLEFKPIALNLSQFCRNLVNGIEEDIHNKKRPTNYENSLPKRIDFEEKIPANRDAEINCIMDEKLLRQILTNLLANALKYSATNVRFELAYEDNMAVFQIQDSGIGISPEDQLHIFEPFHRGNNVENRPGTGLGLAIVKKCVELHKGQISVESQVGQGTTFTVKLPLEP
ncbi:ATP-binding protein [[Phormidium] sp. ETS-05]|uniref:hybrid sensor histidine kinase/response regulator n=1 Tax=[Phormidium] sp. ETS-05 TaxID=222819 RepID=UPI0018EF0B46|nr:ATP-binding protein [[Phormidium] sp. ETS-05]